MRFNTPFFVGFLLLMALLMSAPAQADALIEYVKKTDAVYAWKLKERVAIGNATVYRLSLTSQTWQGIVWEHNLCLYQPADTRPATTMALVNTGGGPNTANDALFLEIARRIGATVAVLYDVPNQPLFDGKKEDALIAETFVRYLKTGDESWPLLFPMVKSVIRAMDAVQAFSKEEWKHEVRDFVVTGASKRGWTSWLTAATGDKRVKAVAPMVIDTLNMAKQIPHQRESYGTLSEQINDYSNTGLTEAFQTEAGKKLMAMVDPYAYRSRLTLPKLILNGANDPYWSADALQLYWNDLPGEKWVVYVPNAGHNLTERKADGTQSFDRALTALAEFVRTQSGSSTLPRFTFNETTGGNTYRVHLKLPVDAKTARLWVAQSETRDFRKATWKPQETKIEGNRREIVLSLPLPTTGYVACFAEWEREGTGTANQEGNRLSPLCTPVRILPTKF